MSCNVLIIHVLTATCIGVVQNHHDYDILFPSQNIWHLLIPRAKGDAALQQHAIHKQTIVFSDVICCNMLSLSPYMLY